MTPEQEVAARAVADLDPQSRADVSPISHEAAAFVALVRAFHPSAQSPEKVLFTHPETDLHGVTSNGRRFHREADEL